MQDDGLLHNETQAEFAALRARVAKLEAREAERHHAEQIQSALYRIADAASAATDMPEFYAAMHRIVGELMDANHFFIALYDEARQMVSFPFYHDEIDTEGWPAPHVWLPIGTEKTRGMTGYVLRTGRPALITPQAYAELIRQGEIERVGVPPLDWLGVPLKTEEQTLGVVAVQSYREEIRYTEQDKALLSFVAQHIATALSRARAIEETRQRNAELAIVNEVGQALAKQLDFQAIIELIGDRVRAIFDVTNIWIGLYDRQANLIRYPYQVDHGERYWREPLELGRGLTSIVIESRQPLVAGTWAEQLRLDVVPTPGDRDQAPAESWLGVPMIAGDEVIGVVSVHRLEQHAFSESDVNLLSTLASSMSVALENARLFDETRRLLVETEQRNAELAIINSVGEAMTRQLDVKTITRIVGDKVRDIFAAENAVITLFDAQRNLLSNVYDYDKRYGYDEGGTWPLGTGLTSIVLLSRQPLCLGTNQEAIDRGVVMVTRAPGEETQIGPVPEDGQSESWLGVPIVVGDRVIGVVHVDSYPQRAFDERSVRLLSTLAASMGVAIENARLFEETHRLLAETEQRATELAIINSVQQGLAQQLNFQAIIDLVGNELCTVFRSEAVTIALYDQQTNMLQFPYYLERGERIVVPARPFGTGLTSHIIQSRQPLEIYENAEQRYAELGAVFTDEDDDAKSWLGVPIIAGDAATGAIFLQNFEREHAFSQSDVSLLTTLAASMGAALENAGLFDETRRRAREMAALAEVGREISASLDLPTVLERIAVRAQELLHGRDVVLRLLEPDGSLPAVVALGKYAAIYQEWQVQLGYGLTGHIAQSGAAEIVNDPIHDPRVAHIPGTEEDDPTEAMIFAPLLVREEVIGVMTVWRDKTVSGPFAQSDLDFVIGLARQAAIAIVNARLFQAAHEAQSAAEQANTAKSTFLANMSHELRTPLNAIIGFTRIVRRKAAGALPNKQLDNLDKVLTSAEHLLGLINTVLDIAKIEAGRMEVQPVTFNPAALIEACATTALPLLRPGVTLVKDVAADLPPVFSDQDKVRQILLNLLSNAAKFTHHGTITLRVTTDHRPPTTDGANVHAVVGHQSSVVEFEVIDTGIGIALEALGRIFEEFQQADTSTTRKYGGTGLGLAISRHLARRLGGDLMAASAPDAGSIFTLVIPLHYGEQLAPAATAQPESVERLLNADRPVVLVIDDDPDALEILRDNLAEAGYQVVSAGSGEQGLQKAHELHPYAITLDIMMPNKDGWQVLHDLKSDPSTRDIPVILLTIVDNKALGYQLGAADYLVKPLDREALVAALDRMAQANGGAPTRLLVVDDDPNVADMVRQLLAGSQYMVTAAADGIAALEAIARGRPDALLLDLMMPRLDGFGVIEQLRQNPAYASIPIIVLTAKALSSAEAARLRESVSQIIQKQGLEGDTLLGELERMLQPPTR